MRVFITGASSGLGAEFARQYASKEVELILLARRKERLESLADELHPKCKSVEIIVADVRQFHQLQNKISHLQNLDILILNAGISLGHAYADIPTIDAMEELFDVNVLANHAILEVLLPKMKEQGSGKIVFISSLASLFSMPSSKIYSASKRALNAYAEGIRYKYAPYGIKVINILPGFIKSELTDKNDFSMPFLLRTQEGVARMKQAIEKNKREYCFPKRFCFLIHMLKILPNRVKEYLVHQISN